MSLTAKNSRRIKVKSGCRTCKIRKVKCDEARPACKRCVTTGRVCDGYGIWGGGGNAYHERYVVEPTGAFYTQVVSGPRAAPPVLVLNPEEQECFEWFKYRTSVKLPGSYASGFWNTLIFQSSVQEPAVLNAVLALGSYHKKGTVATQNHPGKGTVRSSAAQERFTVQHYVEAMRHLQPHFSSKGKASTRVALIACFLFVSFELLRGHFEAARVHLDNGLRILEASRVLFPGEDGKICARACLESVDNWIVEAFLRIQLQVGILRYTHAHPFQNLMSTKLELPRPAFRSAHEAWQYLSPLLSEVLDLTQRARSHVAPKDGAPRYPGSMFEAQARIQAGLWRWLPKYREFYEGLEERITDEERRGYHVPYAFHRMATIMANTCLSSDDCAYDSQTEQFVLLLQNLTSLRKLAPTMSPFTAAAMDMSRSIVDMGWIPPLYFTAVKCRVHRLRLQAVRLLESTFHREGMWDSRVAACVARKVMELEEQNTYRDVETDDEFPLCSPPRPNDFLLPMLPESHKLRSIELALPGAPMERIVLWCKWGERAGNRESAAEYSMHTRRWTSVKLG